MRLRRVLLVTCGVVTALVGVAALLSADGDRALAPHDDAAPALHVSGNRLVDDAGKAITLRGVNRSGAEFACVEGKGIFDGPMDAASVAAIRSWHANAVRVPLNEDCWLALPNVKPMHAGRRYRTAIKNYVDLLHQHGLVAILDLHWTHGAYTDNSSDCTDPNATYLSR